MADFSCYGGASDEWLALEPTLPPSQPADPTTPGLRETVNAAREAASADGFEAIAPRLLVKNHSIPTRDGAAIEARSYRPLSADTDAAPLPLYIHYHGGGYYFGTLSSEDGACGKIALGAQVMVLNVNYRHTPEVRYPTPFDDAEDAFLWAHEHISELGFYPKVVLGGISAGAHFAASITLRQHLGRIGASLPKIAGQVLMIPVLVSPACYAPQLAKLSDPSASSYTENEHAPILPKERYEWFVRLLDVQDPEGEGLKLSPGNATPEQVRGLPPSVFGITGRDMLRDEGLLYAKMLAEAG